MLLDPREVAPRLQFHADVDRSMDSRGVHTTSLNTYREHYPSSTYEDAPAPKERQ